MNKREKTFHPVPGKTNIVEHFIRLSQIVPVRRPMYRVQAALQDPVRKELKSMLKQGIIDPSTSPCQEVKDHTNGGMSVRRLSTQ